MECKNNHVKNVRYIYISICYIRPIENAAAPKTAAKATATPAYTIHPNPCFSSTNTCLRSFDFFLPIFRSNSISSMRFFSSSASRCLRSTSSAADRLFASLLAQTSSHSSAEPSLALSHPISVLRVLHRHTILTCKPRMGLARQCK